MLQTVVRRANACWRQHEVAFPAVLHKHALTTDMRTCTCSTHTQEVSNVEWSRGMA